MTSGGGGGSADIIENYHSKMEGEGEEEEEDRASKARGHADACLRKIFLNPRKILTFECKTCKTGHFSYLLDHLIKFFFLSFMCFTVISAHNSAPNLIKLNFDRAKKNHV